MEVMDFYDPTSGNPQHFGLCLSQFGLLHMFLPIFDTSIQKVGSPEGLKKSEARGDF